MANNEGSFKKRVIELRITLANGKTFKDSGGKNTKVIKELAVSVHVDKKPVPAKDSAKVTVWGVKTDDIEQITTLAFKPLFVARNKLEIWAGDETELSNIFTGDITSATADYNSVPDLALNIEALTGYFDSCTPASVYTYKGTIPAADIFQRLAQEMGKSFENKGVTQDVKNVALSGDPWRKTVTLAKQLHCELIMDGDLLWVAPNGTARGNVIPLWNKAGGLKKYPTFTQQGIQATSLFDPRVVIGGKVKLETVVPKASGEWRVVSVIHSLDAYRPGPWDTTIQGMYNGGLW